MRALKTRSRSVYDFRLLPASQFSADPEIRARVGLVHDYRGSDQEEILLDMVELAAVFTTIIT